MVITYNNGYCVKITQGDTTIAINPHDKKSSYGGVRFGADVALVSLHHQDFEGTSGLVSGSKEPFIVDGPGEYEVGPVTIRGFGIKTMYEGVHKWNTIYQLRFEGMNILVLGALGDAEIDPKILGEIDEVDVLILPIGGGDVLDVPAASKLATKLEAHCVIPVGYDAKALDTFLKEQEAEDVKPVDKLTVKVRDVQAMEGDVVVLRA